MAIAIDLQELLRRPTGCAPMTIGRAATPRRDPAELCRGLRGAPEVVLPLLCDFAEGEEAYQDRAEDDWTDEQRAAIAAEIAEQEAREDAAEIAARCGKGVVQ